MLPLQDAAISANNGYSRDFDSHVQRLQKVFERLRGASLKLHVKKCCLFLRKVAFLGHVLSEAGIEMQVDKVAAVYDWPMPKTACSAS